MIKVTLLLGSILVLTAAAVLNIHEPNIVDGCQSETEVWGSQDGMKFYFCLGDNLAIEQSCEPNTFFVKNDTVSGCVPVGDVSSNCVYHGDIQPCEGAALSQPQPHPDPNQFYVCPSPGAQPVALTCTNDTAFLNQNGYTGCFAWPEWRKIRDCY